MFDHKPMNKIDKAKVTKNTLFILSAQVINILLQMVYLIFAARLLGNIQFGKLSFVIAFTQMFLAVVDFGLFNYCVREIAKKKEEANSYFVNLFLLKLIFGMSVLGMMVIIVKSLGYPAEIIITTLIFGVGLLLFSLNTVFHAVFQSFEKLKYISITMVVFFGINVTLSIIVLVMGKDIVTLACVNCLAGGVAFFINLIILLKKFFVPKLSIDLQFCKQMLFLAMPIGIGAICWSFYNRIDVTLLSYIKGDVSVGEYTAAYRLVNTLAVIPHAYLSAVYPIMARYNTDKLYLNDLCRKSCRLMIAIAFPVVIALNLFAPQLIEVLYGTEYSNAISSLRILSGAVIFIFISNIFGYLLISTFKTSKEYTLYAIMGLGLNIACNCFLIPLYDLKGAALSTVITEVFILGMYYRSALKLGFCVDLTALIAKPLIVTVCLLCFVYLLGIKSIFTLSLLMMSYLMIIMKMKVICWQEIKEAVNILKP